MHQLILFASGRGSNAQAIIDFFKKEGGVEVALIVSNKEDAGVLEIAARQGIPSLIAKKDLLQSEAFIQQLSAYYPALIVLAGFLLKIPAGIVAAFPDRIINIHPALLPLYGGKGMWGQHVHTAVLAGGEAQSGITIHQVNEHYDEGSILLQARCPVLPGDTPDTLAARIHGLEHFYFPRAIQHWLVMQDGRRQ